MALGQLLVLLQLLQLHQQALLQVACADAGRLERLLDQVQRLAQRLHRRVLLVLLAHLLQRGAQIPLVVEVQDDRLARDADVLGTLHEGPLVDQVAGERLAAGGGVGHRVHLAVALPRPTAARRAVHAVIRALPLVFHSSFSRYSLIFDSRSKSAAESPPASRALLSGLVVSASSVGRSRSSPRFSLSSSVGFACQFLLDPLLQRHQGELENLHALDHARREELSLLHPHRGQLG